MRVLLVLSTVCGSITNPTAKHRCYTVSVTVAVSGWHTTETTLDRKGSAGHNPRKYGTKKAVS